MKNLLIALIGMGLCMQARAASLTTTDGAAYNNITSQRVDPDGLYIEYTLPGGGLGMSKIKFARLSEDQQKQYGYNATTAAAYTAAVAKANEDFRQESIRWDQEAKAQRTIRQAQDVEMEKAVTDRLIAVAQLKQEQAPAYTGDGGYGGGWGGAFGIPTRGLATPAKTQYAPVVTPVPFPRLNLPQHTR